MPLQRTLEPELMDTPAEAMAYDAMDHSDVNGLFVEDLLRAASLLQGGTADPTSAAAPARTDVLDLGTGTAQIPIALCRRCDAVRVLAVDAATSMLDAAIANIDVAGFRDRVQLACADAKQLPYEDGRFSVVMSNSIVHHISEPLQALREAVRVTASGGLLFFRDLLRPDAEPVISDLIRMYAGDADEEQRKMFADSLRASLTLDEMQKLVATLGFSTDSVEQTSDRHWTWTVRKP